MAVNQPSKQNSSTSKDGKSEFGKPQDVWDVCKAMQDIEDFRASDRSLINNLFNGGRPYTAEEAEKSQIQINVNWGEGSKIIEDANRMLNNALLHTGTLFNCTLEKGQLDKRDEWSSIFTRNIHVPIQRGKSGKKFHFLIRQRNATICMHGIGAMIWPNDFSWKPRFLPLEDLLIPTDTYCDFSNMRYFAVNFYLTPGEMMEMAIGENVAKGWDRELVKDILESQKGLYNENRPSTWRDQPEAMKETLKQNKGWYYSDAIPKIKLRAFYWQEVDKPNNWYRHILLRESVDYKGKKIGKEKFVYDGTGIVFAKDIGEILNVQYGDSNLVAPFKYHSVRGLGVKLYAPVETSNRLRCEFVQHVFEQLKMYFKIQDPADRDRLKDIVLSQFGFIPEGLTIVPQNERHQVDEASVVNAMTQMRQIMAESSSSFVQNVQDNDKEMTATEANARHNSANVMVAGMMQMMYLQEGFFYQELVKRFCAKETVDQEVKDFRAACIKDGIPEELLVAENWFVTPERVLGAGDNTLAQQQSMWLLGIKNMLNPKAQQTAIRMAVSTMLNDFSKGQALVPTAPVVATDGTYAAENVFGTLMQGVPCALRQGIDQQGYIEGLLKMMGMVILKIQKTDNVGTIDDLLGLQNVGANIGQHIMILAADKTQKALVKQYADALGKMLNEVKGFIQRFMEKRQSQAEAEQGDPAATAKAKGTLLMAATKSKIAEANAAQKQQHKEIAFNLDQARDNLALAAELKREDVERMHKSFGDLMDKTAELMREVKSSEKGVDKNR